MLNYPCPCYDHVDHFSVFSKECSCICHKPSMPTNGWPGIPLPLKEEKMKDEPQSAVTIEILNKGMNSLLDTVHNLKEVISSLDLRDMANNERLDNQAKWLGELREKHIQTADHIKSLSDRCVKNEIFRKAIDKTITDIEANMTSKDIKSQLIDTDISPPQIQYKLAKTEIECPTCHGCGKLVLEHQI